MPITMSNENRRLLAERARLEAEVEAAGIATVDELHRKAREKRVMNERTLLLKAVVGAGIATLQELDALVAAKMRGK